MKHALKLAAVAGLGLGLAGSSAQAELIYGLTTDNNLFSFDSATPGTILSGYFISGLQPNESIVGIDTRTNPAISAGTIYGVGSTGRVYTLNPANGAATLVGAGNNLAPLNGTSFDIDFNPTVDRFRLVSDADQNLRYDPNTGLQTNIDGTVTYGSATNPNLAGIAYTNNFAGATTTTLYAIDAGNDLLNTMNANVGTLTAGPAIADTTGTPLDVSGLLGFDISGGTGIAYVAIQQGGNGYSQFSSVNLTNGRLNNILPSSPTSGLIGGGLFVRDLTVAVPEPTSLAALGIAGVGLLARRRKA